MINEYRYIQIDKNGRVNSACDNPVFVDGIEITIDTEGMVVPTMPMDAIYDLYYDERHGLHYVKIADFDSVEQSIEIRLTEMEEQLLATDEIAVTLFEHQLVQEEINVAQDEAIVALYEMLGV